LSAAGLAAAGRDGCLRGQKATLAAGHNQSVFAANWWGFEFWRFVLVQQEVAKLARTAIDFPPMQKGASFNLEAVKEQIEKAMQSRRPMMRCCAQCSRRPDVDT